MTKSEIQVATLLQAIKFGGIWIQSIGGTRQDNATIHDNGDDDYSNGGRILGAQLLCLYMDFSI
jgi:hypothetical protein